MVDVPFGIRGGTYMYGGRLDAAFFALVAGYYVWRAMLDERRGHETEQEEKQDRQMIELLNELRVAMPGVQILFGFLLTVPFAQGFQHATDFQRNVYYVTLLLVALSTALPIAPSTAHRVLFHERERPWLIAHANRMLIARLGAAGAGARPRRPAGDRLPVRRRRRLRLPAAAL